MHESEVRDTDESIASWEHEVRRGAWYSHADRAAQFGLRQPAAATRLPWDVWAVQGRFAPTDELLRVGFAGKRLHMGHLGLVRAVSDLVGPETVVRITTPEPNSAVLRQFISLLVRRVPPGVKLEVSRGDDDTELEERLPDALRLHTLARIYGWTAESTVASVTGIIEMMRFLLASSALRPDTGGVAFVDVNQATHGALAQQISRRLGRPMPMMAHRVLTPSLRSPEERASARIPGSTVFVDDDRKTVADVLRSAVSGGRATRGEQRARGGEPVRCPVAAVAAAVMDPSDFSVLLDRCRSGRSLCGECKQSVTDSVISLNRAVDEAVAG